MGRGDRKTRKGKTAVRSYGNARPHKLVTDTKGVVAKKTAAKPAAKKAAPAAKRAPAKKAT